MDVARANEPRFEEALARLEAIVKELEEGAMPLDQAMTHFEEGVALAKVCRERLEAAEAKILLLTKENRLEEFEER
ncbi:MAG: exodeoxyribonuclease VII small subunit [Methanobacteriota archaeon]